MQIGHSSLGGGWANDFTSNNSAFVSCRPSCASIDVPPDSQQSTPQYLLKLASFPGFQADITLAAGYTAL